MTYPTDEETFDARNTPEWIREGHLNSIQSLLKRIQDFLGYGGRLSDKTGLVFPVGAWVPFGGVTAPAGWLMCDGRDYDSTHSDYSDLYAVIGQRYGFHSIKWFNVPDFRGVFIRGHSKIPEISFDPGDVDVGGDKIDLIGYGYRRNAIPLRFTTDGTLPAPLAINTTYYSDIRLSQSLSFCETRAKAIVADRITLTDAGVGTSYINSYLEEDKGSRLKLAKGGSAGDDLGSYQEDEFKEHEHPAWSFQAGGGGVTNYSILRGNFNVATYVEYPGLFEGGKETRPRNVYANYIIKR